MDQRRLKRKKVNLNTLIDDEGRKRQKVCGNIKVYFDGNAIVNAICRMIRRKDVHYIMGACAWFTNKKIIQCMSTELKGCCIVTTRDKILTAATTKRKYSTLPVYRSSENDTDTAVRFIGNGARGYNKSLMHHKFLIALDERGNPLCVSTGSFNLTQGATNHLENCNIIEDVEVAKVYLEEFINVYKISSPLKL